MSSFPTDPLILSGLIFGGALVVASVATGWYLRWALRHQILDRPNERSSHRIPTPRGGGVGLVFAMLLSLAIWAIPGLDTFQPMASALWLGTLLLAGVSWFDDLRGLPALVRLAVQSAAAAAVVIVWGMRSGAPGFGTVAGFGLALFLVAWIVTHVNFYNFMDGIDGLAAGQATLVGLAWMIAGWWQGTFMLMALGAALGAACLAFLRFNWPPARLFMGDVGSASLGFIAGTLPLLAPGLPLADALIFAALTSAPFLIDATLTLFKRAAKNENLLQAHRSHQYQRLVASGWSHRTVTLLYLGWAAACATSALCWIARMPAKEWLAAAVLLIPEVSLALLVDIRCKHPVRSPD